MKRPGWLKPLAVCQIRLPEFAVRRDQATAYRPVEVRLKSGHEKREGVLLCFGEGVVMAFFVAWNVLVEMTVFMISGLK